MMNLSFIGLFGVYYSLQFLSLSDSTVITFLVPICTAIAGSVVLKEKFTVKEGLAGCKHADSPAFSPLSGLNRTPQV